MPENQQLAATLFPIHGLAGHTFALRFLKIVDPIPHDDLRPIRMQQWASDLWRMLKCPVFPSSRDGVPGFLVPAVTQFESAPIVATLHGVPDQNYRVEFTDTVLHVAPGQVGQAERDLAGKIVERSISDAFKDQRSLFWRARWNQYFHLVPENQAVADDVVNAFRGIRFSVVFLDGAPFLAADVLTRYIGRKSLQHHSAEERQQRLYQHVSDEVKFEFRSLFIRDNGSRKFSCRFAGFTGKKVSEFYFGEDKKKTVFDYYKETYPEILLEPWDEAVYVRDHGREDSFAVPASRLFPVFTNDEEGMRQCSVEPWMSPEDRVYAARIFLNRIGTVKVDGKPVACGLTPQAFPRTVFSPPSLEYGEEACLNYAGTPAPVTEQAFNDWRNAKTNYLYKHGTFSTQPLPDVTLLYPESLNRADREAFIELLVGELGALTGNRISINRQRPYRLGSQPWTGAGLLTEAESIAENARSLILPIIILSRRFGGSVYGQLKGRLASLPTQCVDERTVARMLKEGKGTSRIRNLALGVLTAAGIQPWVLADSLAHDFYAGIDVMQNRVSYTYLYGRGGRSSHIDFGEFLRRSRMHESVDSMELRSKLRSGLQAAQAAGAPLRSIVIHRDGRWWSREDDALTAAIIELKRNGTLAADCRVAVVEVRKSHLPVRLFTRTTSGYENPMPGSYLKLDASSVILTTTGRPGVWDRQGRSASTLLLRLVRQDGVFSIEDIARDAYYLTHLNWNAPEIEISLPVTIRWNDDALRYALTSPAEEEAEGGDEEAA